MAEYQGRKVTLDKPSRITKGEAGYGRKAFNVVVINVCICEFDIEAEVTFCNIASGDNPACIPLTT